VPAQRLDGLDLSIAAVARPIRRARAVAAQDADDAAVGLR
jgi:hypothetical protein